MTYHCEHCDKDVIFTISSLSERIDMINNLNEDLVSICKNELWAFSYQESKKRKREVYEKMQDVTNNVKSFVYKKMKI